MDNIDSTIIKRMKKDSRTPFLQIADDLNVSEGTIRKRVKKLVMSKEIRKFTIETKEETFAIVGIETDPSVDTGKIVDKISELNVHEIYEVTGRFDIIAFVPSAGREEVNKILEKIRQIKGVNDTETFTVLKKD